MGREVRRVPKDWSHPKDGVGNYIPLHDGLCEALSRYHREKAMWGIGYRDDFSTHPNITFGPKEPDEDCSFDEWSGGEPNPADYMPDWAPEARTHIQMYENTSEGTPISPVMETPEALACWLVDNNASAFGSSRATYEQWLSTINRGFAVSAVMTVKSDGSGVLESGVAALATHEDDQ